MENMSTNLHSFCGVDLLKNFVIILNDLLKEQKQNVWIASSSTSAILRVRAIMKKINERIHS